MSKSKFAAASGLWLGLIALAAPAIGGAQTPVATTPPPPANVVTNNPMAAPAGTYKVDKLHASVIARAPHPGGYSYNVARFAVIDSVLVWDPARVAASKLTATVDMTPITTPIVYALDLKSPGFLNLAQFPTATFVSTGVRQTGPLAGVITGNLTLMGQTRPVAIDAQMTGAGKTARGAPMVGFEGVMKIKRDDFGLKFIGNGLADTIDVLIDIQFALAPAT